MSGEEASDLTLSQEGASRLKEIEYEAMLNPAFTGKVVYERRGNRIIFSGIETDHPSPGTVNGAENVIKAICKAEGLNWKKDGFFDEYKFFDLSTPTGFPGRRGLWHKLSGRPDIELDQLFVNNKGGNVHVDKWKPINLRIEENRRLFLELPSEQK